MISPNTDFRCYDHSHDKAPCPYEKHEKLRWTVECLSWTSEAQQSVTEIISLAFVNLVALKAGAKHQLLFNKPTSAVAGHK
jgi:hypothetical protein